MTCLRAVLLACAASICPLAASGEASQVPPGLWSYDASAALGPFPMREQGTHCVDRDMASSSYDSLFNDINPNCTVTDSRQASDGYHFTLQCSDRPEGELKGRLIVGEKTASLSATGWTSAGKNNIPVILSASATKLSTSCS